MVGAIIRTRATIEVARFGLPGIFFWLTGLLRNGRSVRYLRNAGTSSVLQYVSLKTQANRYLFGTRSQVSGEVPS